MEPDTDTPHPNLRRTSVQTDLRRAVLRILLPHDEPVAVSDVVAHLSDVDGFDLGTGRTATPSQRVANILAWQSGAARRSR